jgi:hypothetical protein
LVEPITWQVTAPAMPARADVRSMPIGAFENMGDS